MSFCLEFEKKDLLLHPSSRPGGGIGRRAGFRCQWLNGRGGSSPLLGTTPLPSFFGSRGGAKLDIPFIVSISVARLYWA